MSTLPKCLFDVAGEAKTERQWEKKSQYTQRVDLFI